MALVRIALAEVGGEVVLSGVTVVVRLDQHRGFLDIRLHPCHLLDILLSQNSLGKPLTEATLSAAEKNQGAAGNTESLEFRRCRFVFNLVVLLFPDPLVSCFYF